MVFVSHSSLDRELAETIVAALEAEGQDCWVAPRNIELGAPWPVAIARGINRSDLFLVLLSPHARDSEQVLIEANRALARLMPVVTFVMDEQAQAGDLWELLSVWHVLPAYQRELTEAVAELVQHVCRRGGLPGAPPPDGRAAPVADDPDPAAVCDAWPLDPSARAAVLEGSRAAQQAELPFLGTPHLLVGLLRAAGPVTQRWIDLAGGQPEELQTALTEAVGRASEPRGERSPEPTARCRQILDRATKLATQRGAAQSSEADLILALLNEREGLTARIVTEHFGPLDGLLSCLAEVLPPRLDPQVEAAVNEAADYCARHGMVRLGTPFLLYGLLVQGSTLPALLRGRGKDPAGLVELFRRDDAPRCDEAEPEPLWFSEHVAAIFEQAWRVACVAGAPRLTELELTRALLSEAAGQHADLLQRYGAAPADLLADLDGQPREATDDDELTLL